MIKLRWILVAAAATCASALAHFPFVVPNADGATANLLMSETLEPDSEVPIDLLAPTKLILRGADGKDVELSKTKKGHAMSLALPGGGTRVVHGVADLGIMKRGDKPPHWLIYYPKTIVGDAFDPTTTIGGTTPVELVPVKIDGGTKIKYLFDGKPAANAEMRVILPDGVQDDYKTDAEGLSPPFPQTGRYGVWARRWLDTPGEREGKQYVQIRQYATLVFDVPAANASAPAKKTPGENVRTFARLPEAAASFGAVASDGWLYVYGGHIADRHEYSTDTISGKFHRMNLADPTKWETLPGRAKVQGMNLAAYDGKIYRVGGMEPRNPPGEPVNNFSRDDVERYDPAAGKWESLPPIPQPRSSHDIAFVGSKLYVLGGWHMKGQDDDSEWLSNALVLDTAASEPKWESIPQPFSRRALIVASVDDKIYVMGGFDANDKPQLDVDILDTKTNTWSKGPAIPGRQFNGFSPAACVAGGKLYLSVGTGDLYTLSADGSTWEAQTKSTPRIVHRLIPNGNAVLILGGAAGEKMLDLIESVALAKPAE